jgi:hypothetical protein
LLVDIRSNFVNNAKPLSLAHWYRGVAKIHAQRAPTNIRFVARRIDIALASNKENSLEHSMSVRLNSVCFVNLRVAVVTIAASVALACPSSVIAQIAMQSSAAPLAAATEHAEKMLNALGGRASWAALMGTVNDSQQFRATAPTEVRVVISMDFQTPRIRIETFGKDLHLIRVIDGERSWRKTRDGVIEAVPKATYDDDMRWYAAHVYRTIHRIAINDTALELRTNASRLEVWEQGKRLAWYKLNSDFEPFAFGAYEDDQGTVSGPWKHERNGIKHPQWTARPDGTWRAALTALDTKLEPSDALFRKPAAAP